MPYTRPDVFVTVVIPDATPQVTIPSLRPVMVGEHYFVRSDAFVEETSGAQGEEFAYPGLPRSKNDTSKYLEVDTASEYAPVIEVIADDGEVYNVTDYFTITGSSFTIDSELPTGGALYISYRARDDRYAGVEERMLTARSLDNLLTLFGGEDGLSPANPLGYAMYTALLHTDLAINGVAITNPVVDGVGSYSGEITSEMMSYRQAFEFLEKEEVYAIVPLTHNTTILDLAVAHAEKMSSDRGLSERRVLFTPEVRERIPVRGGSSFVPWHPILPADAGAEALLNEEDGSEKPVGSVTELGGYQVLRTDTGFLEGALYISGYVPSTASDTIIIEGEDFQVLESQELLVQLDSSAVKPQGRRIKSTDEFEVTHGGDLLTADIVSVGVVGFEDTVKVDFGPSLATGETIALSSGLYKFFRVIDMGIKDELVGGYKQIANAVQNERAVLVGPDRIRLIEEDTDVPGYFGAAQLAAEVCKTGQQRAGAAPGVEGLTNLTSSLDSIFYSSRFFTKAELDEIAGSGWTILVNNEAGQPLVSRHTLTTDMSSVERQNFILGVERDFLARTIRDEISPMTQRFRIDRATINTIALRVDAVANRLSDDGSPIRTYRDIEPLSIRQSEEQNDKVEIEIDAVHLYPFNYARTTITIVT